MRICDLLKPQAVELDFTPVNKEAAIGRLVELMDCACCLNDAERYRLAVFERERQCSTGLGEGIAIPHAKSAGVSAPGLAAMVVKDGVDFDAIDGEKVKLIFLIASPLHASDEHLDVLARLSTLLVDEEFRQKLICSNTPAEFLSLVNEAENADLKEEEQQQIAKAQDGKDKESPSCELVAVTACPAGLSHTYMAAEALEQKAKELGIRIKVEADGAAGNRNRLLPEEIAGAKAVIVAADRAVDLDRFMGKPMVRVGVVEGVRHPGDLIEKALDPNCPVYEAGSVSETAHLPMKLYRHLMSGLTYILPLAATAGILTALARVTMTEFSSLALFLESIGYSIGTLIFPVLSAFIAFSMAGRMALVAGFTGGIMADLSSAGVVGAVLNGFVGGAAAFLLAKGAARFLKGHDAMFALLVYPLLGATLTTLAAQFVTNLPSVMIDGFINRFLAQAPAWQLSIVGAVLAGMMSADMGGPFNKIAYATGVLLLADCLPESGAGAAVMAAVMAGGMIPPISAGLASKIFGSRFSDEERKEGLKAIIKGFLFITEAVIPFLRRYQGRMRLSCIAGSACAGALSMGLHCEVCAPHGGIFLIPLAINPLYYVLSLAAGIIAGTLLFGLLRPHAVPKTQEEIKG